VVELRYPTGVVVGPIFRDATQSDYNWMTRLFGTRRKSRPKKGGRADTRNRAFGRISPSALPDKPPVAPGDRHPLVWELNDRAR
jgi:hypothetical protein